MDGPHRQLSLWRGPPGQSTHPHCGTLLPVSRTSHFRSVMGHTASSQSLHTSEQSLVTLLPVSHDLRSVMGHTASSQSFHTSGLSHRFRSAVFHTSVLFWVTLLPLSLTSHLWSLSHGSHCFQSDIYILHSFHSTVLTAFLYYFRSFTT